MYVGAHVDMYALTCAEMRKAYRLFVYVDGTPGEQVLDRGLCRRERKRVLMSYMHRMGGRSEFTRQPCGGYSASIADDSSVIYYFNSPDCT